MLKKRIFYLLLNIPAIFLVSMALLVIYAENAQGEVHPGNRFLSVFCTLALINLCINLIISKSNRILNVWVAMATAAEVVYLHIFLWQWLVI